MIKTKNLKYLAPLAAIACLLPFENCAQTGDSPGVSGLSSSSSSGAAFAYVSKVDTIAFMSCDGNSSAPTNRRAYFTLRAGAYKPGMGLGLSPSFYTATQYMNNNQRAGQLADSDANSATFLQLSLRAQNNYTSLLTLTGSSSFTPKEDVDTFLPLLTSPQIAGPVSSLGQGASMNYFPGQTGDQRLMEATMSFPLGRANLWSVESQFASQAAVMVMGYTKSGDSLDQHLRSPADFSANPSGSLLTSNNSVYGTAFSLGISGTSLRQLGSVTEKSIDGMQVAGTWNCSQKYMVVRSADAAALKPKAEIDPLPSTSANAANYAALRRVLRAEDWHVAYTPYTNFAAYPIVYSTDSADYCYEQPTNMVLPVKYAAGANCNANPSTNGSQNYLCPHFVTVCTRN